MKLCTFEVATHVGRHRRVGAYHGDCIVDLNFATAWYLDQQGETEPQRLANALVPANILDFLRAGLRSLHTAEELFGNPGPHPPQWWCGDVPPRGPNDETIVYRAGDVELCAPVPNAARVGPGVEIVCLDEPDYAPKLAVVIGKPGTDIQSLEARPHIAGYSAMNDFNARVSALGPYLLTPEECGSPYSLQVSVSINGELVGETNTASLRSKFENAIETLSRRDIILPGDVIAFPLELRPKVKRGDTVELEIERIGALRTPVK